MWSRPDVWKPYINPETPYFNKPPLALFIHGAFLKALGVHLSVTRIPSVLAALGVVLFSVLTVRLLGSRSEAVTSGIVLALTYEFFRRTREISLDLWQLFFVMSAVYLVVLGTQTNRRRIIVAAGVPLGLALLCKPLVALGTIPIFAIWLALMRRPKWIWLLALGTLPVALLVALPWHYAMWREYGDAFLQQYFGNQVLDRARGRLSTNPPYYFASLIARTYWPWALAVGFALWHRLRRGSRSARAPARDLVLLGGVWVMVVLLVISVFPDKKVNYALPVYPMMSWVAAAGICRLPWRRLGTWYRRGLPWLAPAAAAVLILVSVLPIQFHKPADPDWSALVHWLQTGAVSPQQLGHEGLSQEDICQFYLRTGEWLRSAGTPEAGGDERLTLIRLKKNEGPRQNARTVFQSGNLVVLAR
jgi:4-amino-4-deoxy-L-arabinose transferase-like glycosyltransferase